MVGKTDRKAERERRHARVRTKISGTAERPRLCVYRSNKNLFVQVIDDVNGTTLAAASTLDKEVKNKHANSEAAKEVGALIAQRAQDKKIKTVVVGKNVRTIGKKAFYACKNLKKITVQSSIIKKVGAKAFKGINKKAVIKVPSKKYKAYKKVFKGKGQTKTVTIKK